ncbi:MAG: MarR family winged helix-turn-helix transcriptional regulator [Propionibacteriaceae bacterium]
MEPDPLDDVRELVDLPPSTNLSDILGLLDDLEQINQISNQVLQQVQNLTGLRIGEMQALLAIADGADHPRAVAAATGQIKEAAAATVDSLVRRGLVDRHAHDADPDAASDPGLVHITPAGRGALEQSEAIRVRVLDALSLALGPDRTSELRTGIQAVAEVMTETRVARLPLTIAPADDAAEGPGRAAAV